MHRQWKQHLKTDEEKQAMELALLSETGRKILKREKEIINSWFDKAFEDSFSDEDFKNSAWAYKQAYNKGVMKALRRVQQLLEGLG